MEDGLILGVEEHTCGIRVERCIVRTDLELGEGGNSCKCILMDRLDILEIGFCEFGPPERILPDTLDAIVQVYLRK